jgi:signal transduction histidine kinase
MAFHRLLLRVGLPFVLLVMIVTIALAMFLHAQTEAVERARLLRVADSTRSTIESQSLTTASQLARHLRYITGYEVFFRGNQFVEPEIPEELRPLDLPNVDVFEVPFRVGDREVVVLPIPDKQALVMVRTLSASWLEPQVIAAIAAILLLALLTAWLVVRDLVRPLRNLARQLPRIERPGPLELPETERHDEIGDLARAFVRTRDALRNEQEARERAEKLAVLGRMTAALAHEVQNPVAAIRMHAQLLRSATGASDDATQTATTIEHEASRIESLLNQWMYLTRPEPPAVQALDVGALLARVVAMHQAQATHTAVAMQLDAPKGLVAAADGRRLDQVFRNLLSNALQAMPSGGTLAIRAARDADRVRVTFTDSGSGFSPAALERFAEFFFSEREGGMGIGLSVATEIVKAHGGRLSVANGAAGGAVVTVDLLASDAAPQHTQSPVPAP